MLNKNETQKKSVGVQLLSKDSSGELVAILQVRAEWDPEKDKAETFPGACQVTAHGKLEGEEDFIQALLREIKEELGEDAALAVEELSRNGKLTELVNLEKPEKHVITYGTIVTPEICQILLAKPKNKSFGGFRIIKKGEVGKIANVRDFDKTIGVKDENIIAMFPDEKEALEIAFGKLN